MATIDDIKYDDKGLVPAVLIDCGTREVLMVAWMNAESLRMTCESGLATFWSRSRQELWTKGLTSGNLMHVQSITTDCDCDTLLVEVRPDGPACHKGTVSCFSDPLVMEGVADGVHARIENLPRPFDLHMHTNFSDGADTPEAMAEAALAKGMTCLGVSDHGYAPYDTDCCMAEPDGKAYRAAITALKETYAGRLRILCGVEQEQAALV